MAIENFSKKNMNHHIQETAKIWNKILKIHIKTNHSEIMEYQRRRDLKVTKEKTDKPSKEQQLGYKCLNNKPEDKKISLKWWENDYLEFYSSSNIIQREDKIKRFSNKPRKSLQLMHLD